MDSEQDTQPMPGKTRRDEILDYIIAYAHEKNGPTPSIRELADTFELSYSTVYRHIQLLIDENRIDWLDGKILIPGSKWIPPDQSK